MREYNKARHECLEGLDVPKRQQRGRALTKEIAFGPDVELTMVRSGDVLTIYPTRPSIQALIEILEALPKPDQVETRDDDELPKRTGL